MYLKLTFVYLMAQDLKCFVFSLISAHFKIQPISVSGSWLA